MKWRGWAPSRPSRWRRASPRGRRARRGSRPAADRPRRHHRRDPDLRGPATEACRAFPANVNVLAAPLAGRHRPERTRIRLFAVPGLTRNTHRITVEGEFGRLTIEIENVPSENPRTGRLSYLSAIALLRDIAARVGCVGIIRGARAVSSAGWLPGSARPRARPCSRCRPPSRPGARRRSCTSPAAKTPGTEVWVVPGTTLM